MNDKIENWIAELGLLSQIATSEPKVAYLFFFFASGYKCKLTYYMNITMASKFGSRTSYQ